MEEVGILENVILDYGNAISSLNHELEFLKNELKYTKNKIKCLIEETQNHLSNGHKELATGWILNKLQEL